MLGEVTIRELSHRNHGVVSSIKLEVVHEASRRDVRIDIPNRIVLFRRDRVVEDYFGDPAGQPHHDTVKAQGVERDAQGVEGALNHGHRRPLPPGRR